MSDPLDRYAKALSLAWERPGPDASRRAKRLPEGTPLPLPSESASASRVSPEDVRSRDFGDAETGMVSATLARVRVTYLLRPPVGDALWTLTGRAWFDGPPGEQLRVALVQGENVVGEATIPHAGSFRFQDVLLRTWTLEFHFGNGDVDILRLESP